MLAAPEPVAVVGTNSFLKDVADGNSTLEALDLKVKGQDTTDYSYKLGLEANASCTDAAGWSATTSKKDRLVEDLTNYAVGDNLVLCLQGFKIKKGDVVAEQPLDAITQYRWQKTFAPPPTETVAHIGTGSFGKDIADGESTLAALDLKVRGTNTSHYSYKLGLEAIVSCTDAAGWSAATSKNDRLVEDLTSFAVGDDIVLCLRGLKIKKGDVVAEQPFDASTQYRWETTTDLLPDAFSITQPTGTVTIDNPVVTWEVAAAAVSYDVTVATDANCANPVQSSSVTGTSFSTSSLADGTYYSCVTAVNANGATAANNNGLAFNVDLPVLPGLFDITDPTGVITDDTPSIVWTASANASSYDVVVSVDSAGTSIVRSGVTRSTSFDTGPPSLPPGEYYYFVTAINADGVQVASNNGLAFTILGAPGAFDILGPNGAGNDPAPTISWSAAAAAVSYDVSVATDAGCTSVVQSYPGVTATSQALTALADGSYFSCVTANNAGGSTAADNDGLSFAIDTEGPTAPFITAPHFSTVVTSTPIVNWTRIDAESYEVSISSTSDCSATVQSATVTTIEYQTMALADGTYYACVSAVDAVGNTTDASNNGLEFTVDTSSGSAHIVFVSSTEFGISSSKQFPPPFGVINNRQGADWHATFAAFSSGRLVNWNGVDIVYRAVMSDSNQNARDRLAVTGQVFNTNGDLIANDQADFWDGTLQNPIQYDEFGAAVVTNEVWTGSTPTGTFSGRSCGDWNDSSAGGDFGNASISGVAWLNDDFQACSNTGRIYGISPAILYVPDAPGAFDILGPNGAGNDPAPTISWSAAAAAVSYDVSVATDAGCTSVVQSYPGVTGTSHALTTLADGSYFSCVTANNAGGSTAARNDGLAFAVDTLGPAAFSITAPTGTIATGTPLVTWDAATEATSYDVTISSAADCSVVVQSASLPGTQYQTTALADGTYYACVSAVDAVGNTTDASNNGLEFTVDTSSGSAHIVFVSSTEFGISSSKQFPPPFGVINNRQGADWHATFAAFSSGRLVNWNGADIVYRAVMSDSNQNARDRFAVTGQVFNTNGDLIANDQADFWDGTLQNPIQYDEFGAAVVTNEVWTGSTGSGRFSGASCGDWNDSSAGGDFGNASVSGSAWINQNFQECSNTGRIYGISPAITPLATSVAAATPTTEPAPANRVLLPVVAQALQYWADQQVVVPPANDIDIGFGRLVGNQLAIFYPDHDMIVLDGDAAGYGWSLSGEADRIDLLSAVTHEVGHLLGHAHGEAVMATTLEPGQQLVAPASTPHTAQFAAALAATFPDRSAADEEPAPMTLELDRGQQPAARPCPVAPAAGNLFTAPEFEAAEEVTDGGQGTPDETLVDEVFAGLSF